MEIKVQVEITVKEENIVNLLSNGLAEAMSFTSIDFDEKQYKEAKESLITEGKKAENICREDVYARMLLLGNKLQLEDSSSGKMYDLTLDNIVKQNVDWKNLEDNGDFFDNDAIIQKAVFGRVIYG